MEKPEPTKRLPFNLRNNSNPRLLIIPASTKPTEILITTAADKKRVWLDGLPLDTGFGKPSDEDVDKKP